MGEDGIMPECLAIALPIAGGAFLGASVGDTALTLGGRHG